MIGKNKLHAMMGKYGYGIVVFIIVIFLISIMSFNCYGSSLIGDEYFSMGFANNTEDFLFLTLGRIEMVGMDNWIEGRLLHDWITVQEDGRFAIMDIHRNVRDDVHPPLYFMLLNCISSFFVDEVTLFPGYLINVISGTVMCIFMYLIMRKIFVNKWVALLPPMFWAVSIAGSFTMAYIRMYAPLCALVVFCLYLHMLYLEQKAPKIWTLILLFGCTLVGTLTHYYYYIAQLVLFIVMIVVLLFQKQIKRLFFYGMSLLLGEIVSFAAYPYVIRHLLYSERGTQVQENLANYSEEYYKEFFIDFMFTINQCVYDLQFKRIFLLFVVCVIVAGIITILIKKGWMIPKHETIERLFVNRNSIYSLLLIVILTIGYFLILFKISYSSRWHYISPIFSLLAIITIAGFIITLNKMHIKYYGIILFIICLTLFLSKGMERIREGILSNEEIQMRHKKITSYSASCDVLFFYEKWNNLYDNQILELMEFDQIRAIAIDDIEKTDYQEILASRKDEDDIVIYIPTEIAGYQQKISYIAEQLNGDKPTLIHEDKHAIYSVKLN